ncbi:MULTISPECIES: stationary-phase-induced ribosome-associated protein [Serratia]|uniref:stationary-phase-induced ribosome-associated protein n=1 Tax=Serratia TaxID=613 RepID=UPI001495F6E4|nr:stationary-phase-induced ribosome-associated protein [Serratia marcescens]ELH4247715.1 stationary-phase-induced ribosome-associated protein [Serratia marcescens]
MKSNHAARRQLGMSYKFSRRQRYPWVFLYIPTQIAQQFLLPERVKGLDEMAVKYEPTPFHNFIIDAYGYYPVSAFYPAHVANVRAKE